MSPAERQALVHTDALFGAAYRLTLNARDAEDLVQDSLLPAYQFWASFAQASNSTEWLPRLAPTTVTHQVTRNKRQALRRIGGAE